MCLCVCVCVCVHVDVCVGVCESGCEVCGCGCEVLCVWECLEVQRAIKYSNINHNPSKLCIWPTVQHYTQLFWLVPSAHTVVGCGYIQNSIPH